MLCKNVLPLLSEFYDEILETQASVQVSQHLDQCGSCRKEFESLSALESRLKSLKGVQAPEFLGSLVKHKIAEYQQDSWRKNLQNELERIWSKIRTTESTWYITKALGTVMTSLFFLLIGGNNIPPLYISASMDRESLSPDYRLQLSQNVMTKLGMPQTPKPRVITSNPAINEAYLNDLGQSMSEPGKDDALSVLAKIDPIGSAKIQNVIERPNDQKLLNNVNEVISKARCRPASKNGKAVPSYMLFLFYKTTVYERLPEID